MMSKQTGIELIAAERQRQVEVEGWTTLHDDTHNGGELAAAAACYASYDPKDEEGYFTPPETWPWDASWWKPSVRQEVNLVKAGALIAAEIDRLHRLTELLLQDGEA